VQKKKKVCVEKKSQNISKEKEKKTIQSNEELLQCQQFV
jgi:hypothetical protein